MVGVLLLGLAVLGNLVLKPIGLVVDRLSASNDPALLRLEVLAAAANGDARVTAQVAALGKLARDESDIASLALAAKLSLAFTDQVEPAARAVGIDIEQPQPAPSWLIPCFRDVQGAIQAAGARYAAAATGPVGEVADLLTQLVPSGANVPLSGVQVSDPYAACQRISAVRRVLEP